MALTPQISLTALLQDISGNAAGTVASPAIVRIALAAFGPELPSIPGTSNVALVGPHSYLDEGTGVTIALYGNDVITPAGTYYAITLLDGDGNIVQCAAYRFNGTLTIDLADAVPIAPSPPLPPGLSFLFLTNGAANIDQDGLELDSGSGVTLTNTGGRKVRIDASGSTTGAVLLNPTATQIISMPAGTTTEFGQLAANTGNAFLVTVDDVGIAAEIFTLSGNQNQAFQQVSANTTLTGVGQQANVLADASSSSFTITLPLVASGSGTIFVIKRQDVTPSAHVVTIAVNTGTIDGATSITLTNLQAVKLLCDGAVWNIIAEANKGIPNLVIGFGVATGLTGTDVTPLAPAPRAATLANGVVAIKTADATVDLTYDILKNGTSIFTSARTVAHASTPGSVVAITGFVGGAVAVAANDVFSLNITGGTANWAVTIQVTN